eukprot:4749726-Pleurochrysis_carterae.AAC.1
MAVQSLNLSPARRCPLSSTPTPRGQAKSSHCARCKRAEVPDRLLPLSEHHHPKVRRAHHSESAPKFHRFACSTATLDVGREQCEVWSAPVVVRNGHTIVAAPCPAVRTPSQQRTVLVGTLARAAKGREWRSPPRGLFLFTLDES